jgi:hypothetical protein
VLNHDQVVALGGTPQATFAVTLREGFTTRSALTGALIGPSADRGMHGYNPQTTPDMRASFFLIGPKIAPARDLGIIDMRRIAPTVAHLLGISLPTATQPALAVR